MRLFGIRALSASQIRVVLLEVPLEPHYFRVSFEREDLCGDTVEKPRAGACMITPVEASRRLSNSQHFCIRLLSLRTRCWMLLVLPRLARFQRRARSALQPIFGRCIPENPDIENSRRPDNPLGYEPGECESITVEKKSANDRQLPASIIEAQRQRNGVIGKTSCDAVLREVELAPFGMMTGGATASLLPYLSVMYLMNSMNRT